MLILNVTKLIEIFIEVDDFIQELHQYLDEKGIAFPEDSADRKMNVSERLTIVIFYHVSGFKCFKWYYQLIIRGQLRSYFPSSYSYERFVNLQQELDTLLGLFLCAHLAAPTEANFIDSKKLVVCHNKRIKTNRVFRAQARRGKSSTGWFYGFKLHLIINHLGQIVLLRLTPGNVADNNQKLLKNMAQSLNQFIRLFADRGYHSKIKDQLAQMGFHLIAKKKKNMKAPQKLTAEQKYYAKHRGLIETVFDLLKFMCDIEHSRHRKFEHFIVNVFAALCAYLFMDHKPAIRAFKPQNLQQYQQAKFMIV